MITDNFDIITKNLIAGGFLRPGDFFVVHVIQRAKDLKASGEYGEGDAKESQRLIKTWYIDSVDYWEKKIPIIKEVAEMNHARAYILPQVRNRLTVNRVLAKKVIEAIDDTNLRYDHLIRTAVCGCHSSERPMWVIDLDKDGHEQDWGEYVAKVEAAVIELLRDRGCEPDECAFEVPTPNGLHIVTWPFNKSKMKAIPLDEIKSDAMTLLYYNDGK